MVVFCYDYSMPKDQVVKEIENEYFDSLVNMSVGNPRLMVLFSGPPGSGKSVLAKLIEKEFSAIRLENDAIRSLVHAHYPKMSLDEKAEITLKCMYKCWDRLLTKSSNGLWVIDASIDRKYQTASNFAQQNNFRELIIALSLTEEEHQKRIIGRGSHPFASLDVILDHMNQRRTEQDLFLKDHNPDLVVHARTPNEDVIKMVRDKLAKLSA